MKRPAQPAASTAGPDVRSIYVAKTTGLASILLVVWFLKWFVSPSTLAEPITLATLR